MATAPSRAAGPVERKKKAPGNTISQGGKGYRGVPGAIGRVNRSVLARFLSPGLQGPSSQVLRRLPCQLDTWWPAETHQSVLQMQAHLLGYLAPEQPPSAVARSKLIKSPHRLAVPNVRRENMPSGVKGQERFSSNVKQRPMPKKRCFRQRADGVRVRAPPPPAAKKAGGPWHATIRPRGRLPRGIPRPSSTDGHRAQSCSSRRGGVLHPASTWP